MSRISGASQSEAARPIPGVFHTSQSETVRLGARIGTGAEGEVYEIQDQSDLVAKVYHEPPPPEKAEKLVALSRLGNERLFNLSAWPVSTLSQEPDGEILGFVMKKISQAEEVHALHSPKSRLQKFPEASWTFLIYVAANIARAVAAIHEHGLVIGDVNPKNILVTRKATVYLLDVDSFQVTAEGRTYRCEGGFPEYTPPELQGVAFRDVDRAQEHDSFGLAVVIFQLLFLGRHPYSGQYLGAGEMPLERAIRESRFAYGVDSEARKMRQPPGTLALDSMPSLIVRLFRRAFLSTDRPGAREWVERLDELAKALKKCGQHSGHYYYRELSDCPWCGIESHARVRLFNIQFPGDDSPRGHFRLD
jgi:DNA-binding helix-hairpin-helix protein with protein kinase domain